MTISIMILSILDLFATLSTMTVCIVFSIEYRYAESHYAESRYAESRYAESRYAECLNYLNVILSVMII